MQQQQQLTSTLPLGAYTSNSAPTAGTVPLSWYGLNRSFQSLPLLARSCLSASEALPLARKLRLEWMYLQGVVMNGRAGVSAYM